MAYSGYRDFYLIRELCRVGRALARLSWRL